MSPRTKPLTGELISAVVDRLRGGKRVRRLLPGEGRLHIDRPLPFLCVYRRRGARASRVDRLVMTQASYLVAGGPEADPEALSRLLRAIAEVGAERHGGFLVLELWETAATGNGLPALAEPTFTVVASAAGAPASTVERLEEGLERIEVEGLAARVFRESPAAVAEGGVELLGPRLGAAPGVRWLGLGVAPIYRGPRRAKPEGEEGYEETFFPVVLLELEARLAEVILGAAHEFAHAHTALAPPHVHSLGRRALVRSAWNIDRRLAEVATSFEFLRLSTPINEEEAWQRFRAAGGEEPPAFRYAPLPIDPEAIKRSLFNLPIERVEDSTLARLFREKQEELDRKIDMLRDRGTPRYLYGSLQQYGPVEDELVKLAEKLLYRLPSHQRDESRNGYLPAAEMAEQARREMEGYRRRYDRFPRRIELRDDMPPGMMVSQGRLLISTHLRVSRGRVDALLQHEVGTHLLTWCNGRAQPLRLLYAGLPGYDTLQEGLAVLAEYLVGGLSRPRLRLLAARVVACRAMVDGAGFLDTYRRLVDDHGFAERGAFTLATRVYRGGGLTKDAEYLRGLVQILDYLGQGGRLEPLFVGKLARRHLPVIEELQHRGVLEPPPLLPDYLQRQEVERRLARVREGMGVLDMVDAAGPASADGESP